MVSQFEIEDRACGIIMNAKTGAVLAMATAPGFDLNNPSDVADIQIAQSAQDMGLLDIDKNEVIKEDKAASLLASLTEEQYNDAYVDAREQQWKNKAITELYIPGSVFKVITSSAALEENLITLMIRSIVRVLLRLLKERLLYIAGKPRGTVHSHSLKR